MNVSDTEVRYPDVGIQCNGGPLIDIRHNHVLVDPMIIIEVVSPCTTTLDQGTKLEEYRRIASVQTIAFVDPINEMCRVLQRLSATGWNDQMFSGRTGIPLPALDLVIPHDEIFARD